ncbi:MAG: PAS domain-containing protein [Desulfuromonadaceae bacterium]|nr:PAS domain-containing protein [Desulfuromonadaceae bacterium]
MAVDKNTSLSAATELRRQAEERLRAKTAAALPPRTEEELRRLVHELEVHRIELEMQNEELRQARDEKENALEMYTDLYDFAPVGYLSLDRDGTVTAANLTGADLLGIERSLLIGRRFGSFLPENTLAIFCEFLRKVFTSQAKESCEVTLTREGHPSHPVQIEALACMSGQECRVAMIDISMRRQMEKKIANLHNELAARASELETANIELEAFNYSVSHDLRKPLTIITGYCQAIEESYADQLDTRCREYFQKINGETLSMNRLIDTLLNFSRIARVDMHRVTVDLSQMAQEVVMELKVSAPERRVMFRIAEGIVVNGDAGLLRIVLDNIIGNAWKFTGNRSEGIIEFGMMKTEGKPAVFVRDNGPGFDMIHAEKLFLPFQRLPGNDMDGCGIGLAIVDRIVRRHGGRVWAESKPGQESTFFFTLDG